MAWQFVYVWSSDWCTTFSSRRNTHNTNINAEVTDWHGNGICSPYHEMQLFVTKQICWNNHVQFRNVTAHLGGMHIVQSFFSCIGKLIQGSCLEVYAAEAYGGLTDISNRKSCVKAMRTFRVVSAALLKRLLSDGPKTFEQKEHYLEYCSSPSYWSTLDWQLHSTYTPHPPVCTCRKRRGHYLEAKGSYGRVL